MNEQIIKSLDKITEHAQKIRTLLEAEWQDLLDQDKINEAISEEVEKDKLNKNMSNIQNDNFQEENPDVDIQDPETPEPYEEDKFFPNGDNEEELRQERLYEQNYIHTNKR